MSQPIHEKAWQSFRAHAARAGVQLFRTDPADGPPRYFAMVPGRDYNRVYTVRELVSIDDLDDYIGRVAGFGGAW